MILVRLVFQAKFGKAGELVASFKSMEQVIRNTTQGRNFKLLTDLSGPFDTVIQEMEYESVDAYLEDQARMFADPYLLEKSERADLAVQLRQCVAANPQISELRVLLGMALCVNFEVADAIEELNEGVRLDPNSYIAQLKMGELWMRLRVMEKAELHTKRAGQLASNMAQSELARRQAASIRTMKHNGIERGGFKSPLSAVARVARRLWKRPPAPVQVALDPVDVN